MLAGINYVRLCRYIPEAIVILLSKGGISPKLMCQNRGGILCANSLQILPELENVCNSLQAQTFLHQALLSAADVLESAEVRWGRSASRWSPPSSSRLFGWRSLISALYQLAQSSGSSSPIWDESWCVCTCCMCGMCGITCKKPCGCEVLKTRMSEVADWIPAGLHAGLHLRVCVQGHRRC